MIDLRWVKRQLMNGEDIRQDETYIGYTGTRLQYRRMENPLEIGLQNPIWSEWVDVPVEWMP